MKRAKSGVSDAFRWIGTRHIIAKEEADTEAGEHEVDALVLDEVGEQVDVDPGAEGGHQQPQDDVYLHEMILDVRIPGEYM